MITALTGKMERLSHSQAYINVNGVEYEVYVPLDVLDRLQKKGPAALVFLYIYHHFRENEQRLFGFLELRQREFFEALLGLRGLGPSLALSLLSHLSSERFLQLCKTKDIHSLCRIPRVGKSIAESMIFEVSRQRKKWDKVLLSDAKKQETEFIGEQELALQALIQLGYREKEAQDALHKANAAREQRDSNLQMNAAEWIRAALQVL